MRRGASFRMIVLVSADLDVLPPKPSERSTVWARVFASVYDPFLWLGERRGVRALRRELLGGAHGVTVDIGAGTGLNLRHYPHDLGELVLAEPDRSMRRRLERRVRRRGARRATRIVDAPAERLPFPDASIDTVISTFVLCTVVDPEVALREIGRVLRPGGQLLFIEHVRSDSRLLAACQRRLVRPWYRFARGCRCDRPTADLIAASGLTIDGLRKRSWRAMPPIVRPLVVGRARREPS
jgi:ubiquinone/menaquinone biosynthesis C-methylase UbiE